MFRQDINRVNRILLDMQKNWLTHKNKKYEQIYFREVYKCFKYFVVYYCKKKGVHKNKNDIEEILQDCFVKLLVWYKNKHVIRKNPLTIYRYIVFNRMFATKGRIYNLERAQSKELPLKDMEYERCV